MTTPRLEQPTPVILKANVENSKKALAQKQLAEISLKIYTEVPNYRIAFSNGGRCKLIPHHQNIQDKSKPVSAIDPEDNKYYYVIIPEGKDKLPELILGRLGHFWLAGGLPDDLSGQEKIKMPSVLAAGEIIFKDNKILEINANSGTFCIKKNDLTNEAWKNYTALLNATIKAVGLPHELYNAEYRPDNNTDNNTPEAQVPIREENAVGLPHELYNAEHDPNDNTPEAQVPKKENAPNANGNANLTRWGIFTVAAAAVAIFSAYAAATHTDTHKPG